MRLIKSKTFGGFKSASALHLLRNLLHITSMQSTRRRTATFVLPFPPVLEWTSTNMIETPSPGDRQQALIQTTSEALRKHKSSWWFCRHWCNTAVQHHVWKLTHVVLMSVDVRQKPERGLLTSKTLGVIWGSDIINACHHLHTRSHGHR